MPKPKTTPLTQDQLANIIQLNRDDVIEKDIDKPIYSSSLRTAFIWLLVGVGLTPLEASRLKLSDVEDTENRISFCVNNKKLIAPFVSRKDINIYLESRYLIDGASHDDDLFFSHNGQPLKVIHVQNAYRPVGAYDLVKECMVIGNIAPPYTSSVLRETFFMGLFQTGASPEDIAEYVGMNARVIKKKRQLFSELETLTNRVANLHPHLK